MLYEEAIPQWLTNLAAHIPSDWEVIPCNGKKTPVDPLTGLPEPKWNKKPGFTVEDLLPYRPEAMGVLLGPSSGGLLAIDFDGPGSEDKFAEVFGHPSADLPATIAWTSGKDQRRQLAFVVPRDWWGEIKAASFKSCDGATVLEARWEGQQSIIAGTHPETGSYQWLFGCSPEDCSKPAEAPEWLLMPLLAGEAEPASFEPSTEDASRAVKMLQCLPAEDFSSYWRWLKLGMALHHTDPGLLSAWVEFSGKMQNFDEQECLAKWKSFGNAKSNLTIASLHRWAKKYGYTESRKSFADDLATSTMAPDAFAAFKQRFRKANRVCADVTKVPYRIEGFAVSGLVLLAADTGTGKTTLLYRAADAIQSGSSFLESVPVRQGSVLVVQGDEPEKELLSKVRRMGLEAEWDYYCPHESLNLDFVLKVISEKEYDVMIIDSLTTVLATQDCTTLDQAMIEKLYKLNDVAVENDVLLIMTAHLNKAPKNGNGERYRPRIDWHDISGLGTIGAAVSDAWGLTPKLGTDQFSLHALGKRNIPRDTEWLLSREAEDFYWRLDEVTDGMKPAEQKYAKKRILALLDDALERLTTEIAAALNLHEVHARRCLAELHGDGAINRRKSDSSGGRKPYLYSRKAP